MKKPRLSKRFLLFTALALTVTMLLAAAGVVTYAYFSTQPRVFTDDNTSQAARVGMRINLLFEKLRSGEAGNFSGTITYPDGNEAVFDPTADWGTAENPYIISLSRHMINLYVLQRVGYFDVRYVQENYDGNGEYIPNSGVKPYFLVCDPETGQPVSVDGTRNNTNIEIQPIGNDEYPFIGCVGGAPAAGTCTAPNGKTSNSSIIANFTVVPREDEPDVGLFGKIGYLGDEADVSTVNGEEAFNGSVSGVNDLLLYDIRVISRPDSLAQRVADHLWSETISNNVRFEEDHHIGILAGHVEYASIYNISVYYSASDITAIDVSNTGANYQTDSGIIGLVYNLNPSVTGNTIGSASGSTICGKAEGAGQEWGASIDMKTMYDNLLAIQNEADNTYLSTKVIVVDEDDIDPESGRPRETLVDRASSAIGTVTVSNTNYTKKNYYDEDLGSISFSQRDGTNQYLYILDNSATSKTSEIRVTYHSETEEAFTLSKNGSFLNLTADGSAVTATAPADGNTKWRLTAGGNLRTEILGEWYYLNASASALSVSKTPSTVWTENDGVWSCAPGGQTRYLDYSNGAWTVTPFRETYSVSDGAGHYLTATASAVGNAASANAAVQWGLSSPQGATTTVSAWIGGTEYFLTCDGTLSVGTSSFTWNRDGSGLYATVQGVRYNLVYDNGWKVVSAAGKKITDGEGHYLTATTSGVANETRDNAVTWQFSAESGDTQIYTVLNGQKYYLSYNNGLVVSTTAFTWRRAGDSFYYTSGGKDYYVDYATSWTVAELEYLIIHDDAGHTLRVTGDNGFAAGTEDDATHFYFSNANGASSSGTVYCRVNGNTLYLRNNNGGLETSNAANATNWTNDGSSLYTSTTTYGVTTTYSLQYDSGWSIKMIREGKVITDGNGNYLQITGTGNNNYTNTRDINQATRFTFSNNGTNSGTVSSNYNGTTRYLRNYNNGTLYNSGTSTNWSNDGTRLYNGNYRLGYFSNAWQLYNGTSATSTLGYYLTYNGHYLCVNENGGIYDSTDVNDAAVWSGNSGNVYTTVGGTTYYLDFNSTTSLTTSTSSGTNWTLNTNRWRYRSGLTNYYVSYYNNTWRPYNSTTYAATVTAKTEAVTITSLVETVDATRPTAKVGQRSLTAPSLTVSGVTTTPSALSLTEAGEAVLTATETTARTFTRTVANNQNAVETYYPLTWKENENGSDPPYVVHEKNTGYVMSGTSDSRGDIRVSYYAKNNNISASLTNGNLDDGKIYTYNAQGRRTITQVGAANFAKYAASKSDFQDTLNSDNTNVYGLHFMNATISKNNTVTIPKAVINDATYYDYPMPKNSIDFRLRTRGYINFFAGTYFISGNDQNSTFFSLHHILPRAADGNLTEIKEISRIYGVPGNEKRPYIYLYTDGSYSQGNAAPTGEYQMIFDMAWVTNPSNNWTNSAIYYYEIPVNAGEYALGSVQGKFGAYLMYLDIGTSAASHSSILGTIDFVYDNLSDKIVTVTDTSDSNTSLNYYVPSLAVLYSKNTDDNNGVDIDEFTVNVRRTITSVNDANATLTTVFGGDDDDHMAVIASHSGGDTLATTPAPS
ncbi:MAG: hypothetical protein J6Z79_07945 [Clostridia bacterium]|nr:hypothetical protein [Clostridia bacterium]